MRNRSVTPTKPIIVFGTGRNGTTVFYQMLAEHPHLAWLSQLCDQYPRRLGWNTALMRLLDYPALEGLLKRRFYAGECYRFWEHYAKGFRAPCRDLSAADVSVKTKNSILDAMSKMTTEKRTRLLLKITGWPRTGFLSEVFPDAKFIHVIRDGRAVANSLINVGFWRGWEGPEGWRWGPLSPAYEQEWIDHDRSFIVLAAIQWKMLMDAAEEAIKNLEPSRFLQVKYEALCARPIGLFKEVTEFCEIDWNDHFESRLNGYKLRNTNTKFQQELNRQQQEELNEVLEGYLQRYGYL
jgi:hypothetical protein